MCGLESALERQGGVCVTDLFCANVITEKWEPPLLIPHHSIIMWQGNKTQRTMEHHYIFRSDTDEENSLFCLENQVPLWEI